MVEQSSPDSDGLQRAFSSLPRYIAGKLYNRSVTPYGYANHSPECHRQKLFTGRVPLVSIVRFVTKITRERDFSPRLKSRVFVSSII